MQKKLIIKNQKGGTLKDWVAGYKPVDNNTSVQDNVVNKPSPRLNASAAKLSNDNIINDRKKRVANSMQNNKLNRKGFQSSAAGDKLRLFPNDVDNPIDEYLNPLKMIGDMSDGISHSFSDNKSSALNKTMAIGQPLLFGALAGIGAKTTGQFVNNVINPFAGINLKSGANKQIKDTPIFHNLDDVADFESKIQYKKPTLIKKALNSKILPIGKMNKRPNLSFEVSPHHDVGEFEIRAVSKEGGNFGYLGLQKDTNPSGYIGSNGVTYNIAEWRKFKDTDLNNTYIQKHIKDDIGHLSPTMISVDKKLQGNRMQDALYQKGIEEGRLRGYIGIRSGDDLMSPLKTAKAHERFERDIIVPRKDKGWPTDITLLKQHKNIKTSDDWLREWNSKPINMGRDKLSVNDIFNKLKEVKPKLQQGLSNQLPPPPKEINQVF